MTDYNDLSPASKRFLERYPFPKMSAPPLTPLKKSLSSAKIGLITTAGLHRKTDLPFPSSFEKSDCSFRIIPAETDPEELKISHTSKEFDRSGALEDINVVFPIDRIKDLVQSGILAAEATNHFSFMGSLPRTGELRKKTAPQAAKLLREDNVDLVLLTPV